MNVGRTATIFLSVNTYKLNDARKRFALANDIEAAFKRGKTTIPDDLLDELRLYRDFFDALVKKGIVNAAPVITLGELFDQYLQHSRERGLAPNTIGNQKSAIKRALDFFGGGMLIKNLTKQDAQAFDAELRRLVSGGLSPRTRSGFVKRIKGAFKWGIEMGYLDENPLASLVAGSQVNKERERVLKPDEISRILAACPSVEWRALFALAAIQGLRVNSESRALRWQDVDFGTGLMSIYCQKNARYEDKARREMPIFPDMRKILIELRQEQGESSPFVIPNLRGDNVRTTMGKIAYRAGVVYPKPFQNARVTACNRIEKKWGMASQVEWCGHSAKVSLDHYLTTTPETLEEAKNWSILEA